MLHILMENTLTSKRTPSNLTKQDAMKRADRAAGRILHHCSGAGGERGKWTWRLPEELSLFHRMSHDRAPRGILLDSLQTSLAAFAMSVGGGRTANQGIPCNGSDSVLCSMVTYHSRITCYYCKKNLV